MRGPIVFDGSCLGGARPSGVERAFLTTLRAFTTLVDPADLVLFAPRDTHRSISRDGDTTDGGRDLAIDPAIRVVEIPRMPLALWREWRLARELRQLGARALWTPTTALPPHAPCPTIATVHELPTRVPGAEDPPLRALRQERARFALEARATRVVVPSVTTARDLARESPRLDERVRIVAQPLGSEMLEVAASLRDEPSEREARDRTGLVFVGIGRRRKNLDRIAQAWSLLPSRVRHTHAFTWIGSGPRMHWRLRAAGLVGASAAATADLVRAIRDSRGLVLASRSEGFGLPAIEALACGRPPLVARESAPAANCVDLAATCDPYDCHSIAHGLQRLLEDEQLAARAFADGPRTALRFDAESVARAWTEILDEVTT